MCLVAIVLKSLIPDSVTPGYRVTVTLQASREENTTDGKKEQWRNPHYGASLILQLNQPSHLPQLQSPCQVFL